MVGSACPSRAGIRRSQPGTAPGSVRRDRDRCQSCCGLDSRCNEPGSEDRLADRVGARAGRGVPGGPTGGTTERECPVDAEGADDQNVGAVGDERLGASIVDISRAQEKAVAARAVHPERREGVVARIRRRSARHDERGECCGDHCQHSERCLHVEPPGRWVRRPGLGEGGADVELDVCALDLLERAVWIEPQHLVSGELQELWHPGDAGARGERLESQAAAGQDEGSVVLRHQRGGAGRVHNDGLFRIARIRKPILDGAGYQLRAVREGRDFLAVHEHIDLDCERADPLDGERLWKRHWVSGWWGCVCGRSEHGGEQCGERDEERCLHGSLPSC